ncbi:MAG: amidohydrolase family protein [Planctomycetota bacterium]
MIDTHTHVVATGESRYRLSLDDLPGEWFRKAPYTAAELLRCMDDSADAFVKQLVARFGAERVMWGSDFSHTHDRPYAELIDLAKLAFRGLSEQEQERCFVANLRVMWPSLVADGHSE